MDKSRRLRSGLLLDAQWLVRAGLMELVCKMIELSQVYDFLRAASRQYYLDNPDNLCNRSLPAWLSRVMAKTFHGIDD